MRAAWYCRGATWGRTWRSVVLVAVLCGLLGAVSLAALAGARRTESAYGRYLTAINSSDVQVNVPSPLQSLDRRVAVVARHPLERGLAGNEREPRRARTGGRRLPDERLRRQRQRRDLHAGRDDRAGGPPARSGLDAPDRAHRRRGAPLRRRVSAVGSPTSSRTVRPSTTPPPRSSRTGLPRSSSSRPSLVDQFDQTASAVLPPAATAVAERLPGSVEFSWVGVRLVDGSAGIPAFQAAVTRLSGQVGQGYTFAVRKLDTVHQQVQEAIRPQAVALAVLGALAALALLVLVGQALAQQVDRASTQAGALRAMGFTHVGECARERSGWRARRSPAGWRSPSWVRWPCRRSLRWAPSGRSTPPEDSNLIRPCSWVAPPCSLCCCSAPWPGCRGEPSAPTRGRGSVARRS